MSDIVNLTPNPRILKMLGEINFQSWQCIAELIDNSIDAFLKYWDKETDDRVEIRVQIPNASEYSQKKPIVVWDNAGGMSIEQLENALKAGFSGNDPVANLGLFGMGFNIATARLGGRTIVRSTRQSDQDEIEIEIDFAEMIKSGHFERPINKRKKDNREARGTTIIIHDLNERVSTLGQQGLYHLRNKLTDVYSMLLRSQPIDIYINGARLEPVEKCVWRPDRHVIRSSEKIYARIDIDENLDRLYFCTNCWAWLDANVTSDESCICRICDTSEFVQTRERYIKGWLGVQRYYDKERFGIDLYRNGRLVEPLNKSMFSWTNPFTGEVELEYPLEAFHWGGRIVGELEANFLTVNYTKDSFEKSDKHWLLFQEKIRGKGPMRPMRADELGYLRNENPLARLWSGYRKGNKPGYEDLLPGKYNEQEKKWKGTNTEPRAWAELFYKGEEEYLTDQKWWELVEDVEFNRRASSINDEQDPTVLVTTFPHEDESTIGEIDNNGQNGSEDGGSASTAEPLEQDLKLSGSYQLEEIDEIEIFVTCYIDRSLPEEKPFVLEKKSHSNYVAIYKPSAHAFLLANLEPRDLLLMELANSLFLRKNDPDEWPYSKIMMSLKQAYAMDSSLAPHIVQERAKNLVGRVRNALVKINAPVGNDLKAYEALKRIVLREVVRRTGEDQQKANQLIETTAFIGYLPDIDVLRFFYDKPGLFFDGNVFRVPYNELDDEVVRQEVYQLYESYIRDITWVLETSTNDLCRDAKLLARNTATISILEGNLT